MLAVAVSAAACSSLPWSSTRKTEVNVSFTVVDNLPVIDFSYAGLDGKGILATPRGRTVFDPGFAADLAREGRLHLGTEHVVRIEPAVDDLGTLGDALVGSDAFADRVLTIDWRAGLVTIFTRTEPLTESMYRWTDLPAVPVVVDGRPMIAVLDTTNPDSLTLPGPAPHRYEADVSVAGATTRIDIAVDPRVQEPRLGNRVLVNYLTQIDYRRRTAALWKY